MKLHSLAQHLRAMQETILNRWQDEVCRIADRGRELPEPELRDHAPILLQQIITALEGQDTPTVEPTGWEHGRQRWDHAYRVTEVLEELSIMRQVLAEVVDEYAASHSLTTEEVREARRRLHQIIDRSGAASAAQYVSAALHQHQSLEAKLEETNRQKDHFLAMLSHELRAPLAPILNAVRVLQQGHLTDPRLEQVSQIIERQALYQARLINDLLDINRIAEGKITLHPELVDLKTPVGQAVEACLPGIEAKGLDLKLELPDEPLLVDGDPVRLGQIVINVLSNAGRYTDPPGTISLSAGQEDGKVIVRVRDTGIGIAPEMLSLIFDRFVQADTSLDRRAGGLGLGLTLAKKLAELHGGTVEGQSEGLGKGSEFTIRLPAARDGSVAAKTLPVVTSGDRQVSRRVVLVDDNDDARATLADVLEVIGHHVLVAADGPEALRLAYEEQPEAYVVDIGLPGMNGYEVAQQLRQTPGGDRLLLIALSGYGSPADKQRAQEVGFDAHLTKPAKMEELERLLAQSR
jgi:signal transduction histidine kinase/CheY-like chemotaxis protein